MKLLTKGELRRKERRADARAAAKRVIQPHPRPILRVGVDIDNTMIHNDNVWRAYMQDRGDKGLCRHRPIEDDEVQLYWDYWKKICPDCFELASTRPSVLLAHKLRPGVERVLRELTLERVEFSIITGRPTTTKNSTMLWLRDKALCPPRIIKQVVFDPEKSQTCLDLGIDVMIDDSTEVIRRVSTAGGGGKVQTILMAGTHNADYAIQCSPDMVAYSWRDVAVYLESLVAIREAMPHYDALDKAILEEQGVLV